MNRRELGMKSLSEESSEARWAKAPERVGWKVGAAPETTAA
jgi:hypothetical protein